MRRFKHLSYNDRLKIEAMDNAGRTPKEIAEKLGVHISTIYRELKRGRYEHLNGEDWTTDERYSPDIAEEAYRANLAAKGAPLKIGADHELANYIENRIVNDKYSPAAVLGEIHVKGLEFNTTICTSTLYSYIDKGVFLELTNKDLPVKGKKKRTYRHVRQARPSRGDSIEKRPEEVNERTTFGHWEMDTVIAKRNVKRTLLVLSERLTRHEIIIPMKDRTTASVVKALDGPERRYGKLFSSVFRTITVDNGSEFADTEGLERSCRRKGKRTKVYYCHPYSSWERGTNEVQNKMIRRHLPKGYDFSKVTAAAVKNIEDWINNYPREILDYQCAADMFERCLAAIS